MARHATGDRRDETLKQGREEYLFSVAVVVLTISPHFLLGVAFVCVCVCARPVGATMGLSTRDGIYLPEMSCVGVEVAVGEIWSGRKLRLELVAICSVVGKCGYGIWSLGGRDVEGTG